LISPLDAEASLNIQATTGSAGAQVINELFAECWFEESWWEAGSIFRIDAVGSGEAHSRRNQWTTKSFKYSTRTKKDPAAINAANGARKKSGNVRKFRRRAPNGANQPTQNRTQLSLRAENLRAKRYSSPTPAPPLFYGGVSCAGKIPVIISECNKSRKINANMNVRLLMIAVLLWNPNITSCICWQRRGLRFHCRVVE